MQSTNTHGQASAANSSRPGTLPTVAPFPHEGKVRAKQIALYLGIGISTLWLYVKQHRIKRPMRFGARVSVWDAEYIRELAANGIPDAPQAPKAEAVSNG